MIPSVNQNVPVQIPDFVASSAGRLDVLPDVPVTRMVLPAGEVASATSNLRNTPSLQNAGLSSELRISPSAPFLAQLIAQSLEFGSALRQQVQDFFEIDKIKFQPSGAGVPPDPTPFDVLNQIRQPQAAASTGGTENNTAPFVPAANSDTQTLPVPAANLPLIAQDIGSTELPVQNQTPAPSSFARAISAFESAQSLVVPAPQQENARTFEPSSGAQAGRDTAPIPVNTSQVS